MWLLVAFAGGVGNYCNSQMSNEAKENLIFLKTKTGTKQGLIVFRWVLPDSSRCYFFKQTLAGLQKAAASLHPSLSDSTAQTFRHNKSWDFRERHLSVPRQNPREKPRSHVHERHHTHFHSNCPPSIADFSPFGGKHLHSIILFFHHCDCLVLDACEGVFMLICDCWFSCFLSPLRSLWLNSKSAPHVLRRCVRLLQSSQETDDWDICHDTYILENTLNPVGGG